MLFYMVLLFVSATVIAGIKKNALKELNIMQKRIVELETKKAYREYDGDESEVENPFFLDPTFEENSYISDTPGIDHDGQKIKNEFSRISEKLSDLSKKIQALDVETKHMIDYTIKNDLDKLYATYLHLSDENKKNYESSVYAGLKQIDAEINQMNTQIERRKGLEIEKVLQLIGKRYKQGI